MTELTVSPECGLTWRSRGNQVSPGYSAPTDPAGKNPPLFAGILDGTDQRIGGPFPDESIPFLCQPAYPRTASTRARVASSYFAIQ